jgi:hypothetical protein
MFAERYIAETRAIVAAHVEFLGRVAVFAGEDLCLLGQSLLAISRDLGKRTPETLASVSDASEVCSSSEEEFYKVYPPSEFYFSTLQESLLAAAKKAETRGR